MRKTCIGWLCHQRAFCLAAALIVGAGSLAAAQEPPRSSAPPAAPARDFMFGRPVGWVGIRGSWLKPSEKGQLFNFVSNQLTIDKGDFQSAAFTGEAGFAITPRLDIAVGVESGTQTLAS